MDQQVVLKMLAEIDQGTIKSDVAQLAQSMSREMEQVFAKMGENIVQVIAQSMSRAVKDTMRQAQDPNQLDMNFGGTTGQTPRAAPGPGGHPIQPTATERIIEQKPFGLGDFRGGYVDPWRSAGTAASMFVGDIYKQKKDVMADEGMLDPRKAAFQDTMAMKARLYQAQDKAGMPVHLGEGEIKGFEQAREQIAKSMSDLPKHFDRLSSDMEDNAKRIEELTREIKELPAGDELATKKAGEINLKNQEASLLREQMGHLTDVSMGMQSQMSAVNGVLSKQQNGGGMGLAGAAAGIGTLLSAAAQIPGGIRASQIGFAETENLGGRAAMRGDVDRMMAMQMAGGQGALETQGTFEAGLGVLGNLGATIGSVASMPFTGGMGGLAAAKFGVDTISSVANFGQSRQQAVESMLQKQTGVNAETFKAMGAARENAIGIADFTRQTGMYEYAEFLKGGMGPQSGDDMARRGADQGMAMVYGPGMRGGQRMSLDQARASARPGSGYTIEDLTVNAPKTFAQNAAETMGMDAQATQQYLSNMARTVGGVYQGQTPLLARPELQSDMSKLLQINAGGGVGAERFVAEATRQKGDPDTFKKMVQASSDVWKEIIGGGFDKSEMPRIFAKMADQAGAGSGAGEVAAMKERLALQVAASVGDKSGAGIRRAEGVVEDTMRRSFDQNDIMSSMVRVGMQGTKNRNLRGILSGDIAEQNLFLQNAQTEDSIRTEFKKHHIEFRNKDGSINKEAEDRAVRETLAETDRLRMQGIQRAMKIPGYAANIAQTLAGGPGSSMEEVQKIEEQLKKGISPDEIRKSREASRMAAPTVAPLGERVEGGGVVVQQALQNITQVATGMGTLNSQIQALTTGVTQYTATLMEQKARLEATSTSPYSMGTSTVNPSGAAPKKGFPRSTPPGHGHHPEER